MIVIVGAEGLWALGVWIMTDDFHPIRDRHTGIRINKFGGRIVLDRHVWLGLGVTLIGDYYIGEDSIVGQGVTVKEACLASGTISVGLHVWCAKASPGRWKTCPDRAELHRPSERARSRGECLRLGTAALPCI